MTVVNSGGVPNTTANVAHKLLVAWVDSGSTAVVGPQGQNVPLGGGGVGISAGNNFQSTGTINFLNSNGFTFGLDALGNLTATVIPGAAAGVAAVQAGTQTQTSGTLVLSNANGISFGMNNSSVVTASYTVPTQTVQTQATGAIAGTGFTSTTTAGVVMVGTNNTAGLSLGIPNYITTYVGQTTQTQPAGNIAGAGTTTTTQAGSTLGITQNSNGLSLAYPPWLTTLAQTNQTVASGNIAGTGFSSTTTAGTAIVGTNNTAGLSLGVPLYLTTYVGQTTQTQPAGNIAGVGTTFAGVNVSGSMTLNSNGLSLSLSGGAGGGGGFTGGVSTGGNTLGNTGTQTGSLIFVGGNNITLSVATGAGGAQTITISGANAGGAQTGISSIVAGGATYTSGSVQYVNSNGFSWLSTTGQGIVGSYTVPSIAGLISAVNVSAGTTSNNLTALTFNNANGFSFGLNASVITASYTVPTVTNSSWTVSDANTSATVGQLAFTQANGITMSLSTSNNGNHTVFASYTVPSVTQFFSNTGTTFNGVNVSGSMTLNTNGLQLSLSGGGGGGGVAVSAAGSSQNAGTVVFSNSNNFSFGMNGSTVTASYTVPSTAGLISGINVSGGAGNSRSAVTGITFSNLNGITFGVSTGASVVTVTASYTVPTQTVQTIGLYAVGNTTQNSSTTLDARTLSFDYLGAMTGGYSNGSIQISAPATSSISGTGIVSISVNGSTISIGAAPLQLSIFQPLPLDNTTVTQLGQGTIQVYPAFDPEAFSASRADIINSFSVSSLGLSSYAGAISYFAGIYTRTGSTLSLASSGSQSYQFTMSSSNSLTLLSGVRRASMPFNVNYTGGDIWIGLMSLTTSTNGNSYSASNLAIPWGNQAQLQGLIGAAPNSTNQLILGMGFYTATSGAMPVSMAFSNISGIGGGNNLAANLVPVQFANVTA